MRPAAGRLPPTPPSNQIGRKMARLRTCHWSASSGLRGAFSSRRDGYPGPYRSLLLRSLRCRFRIPLPQEVCRRRAIMSSRFARLVLRVRKSPGLAPYLGQNRASHDLSSKAAFRPKGQPSGKRSPRLPPTSVSAARLRLAVAAFGQKGTKVDP